MNRLWKTTVPILLFLSLWIILVFTLSSRNRQVNELPANTIGPINNRLPDHRIEDFLVRENETNRFYERLPNLSALEWPVTQYARLPTSHAPLPPAFEPVMSKGQRNLMIKLLDIFVKQMNANGLSGKFLIFGATLLGSFRHHDFIPWDDDVDVLVSIDCRQKVQKILEQMEPHYRLAKQEVSDKFYTRAYHFTNSTEDVELSRKLSPYSWSWPYLDITYYLTNGTHIEEAKGSYGRRCSWPISVVFPLSYRPFGRRWYPAPRDPLTFLHISYPPTSQCEVFGYSHVLEGAGPSGSVSCRNLGFRYAFVEHAPCGSKNTWRNIFYDKNEIVWSKESLIVRTGRTDRAVIHSICIPVPRHNLRSETFGYNYK